MKAHEGERLSADFWKLWFASAGSNIGDGVLLAALPLLAAQITRDPAEVAGVTVATFLPWLLFGLFAGVIVDRVNRRSLMWMVDMSRMGVLVLLSLAIASGRISMLMVYAGVVMLGIGETLADTASRSILPAIVPRAHLEVANGRLYGAQLAANGFLGPPLGGFLFTVAAAIPFVFDAITFAVSAILVYTLTGSFRPFREEDATVRKDIAAGLAFLWNHKVLKAFAVGAAVINIAFASASAILVLYAQDILGLDDVGFGLLLSGAAVGGLLGSFAARRIVRRLGRRFGIFMSVGAVPVSLGVLAWTSDPLVAGGALAGISFATQIWNILMVSYRQAVVPDTLLGRVTASARLFSRGAYPIGAAIGGLIARWLGLQAAFLVGALLVGLLLAAYFVPLLLTVDLSHES